MLQHLTPTRFSLLLPLLLLSPLLADKSQEALNEQLFEDIKYANLEGVKDALRKGAQANAKNEAGCTALIAAAFTGEKDMIEALLEAGAEVNQKDDKGDTALIAAASQGEKDIIELLLEAGAQVNEKNEYGWTALTEAAYGAKEKDIIELLLEAGAQVNAKTNDGHTALIMHASNGNSSEVIELLLEAGAQVNAQANDGYTALIRHAGNACVSEVIELLLKAGAQVNAQANDGYTALIGAAEYAEEDVCRLLLQHGADISVEKEGQTALKLAKGTQCQQLLQQAHDLFEAIKGKKDPQAIEAAVMNARSNDLTPLMLAASQGQSHWVKALQEAGANPDFTNAQGATAYDLATDPACRKLLAPPSFASTAVGLTAAALGLAAALGAIAWRQLRKPHPPTRSKDPRSAGVGCPVTNKKP